MKRKKKSGFSSDFIDCYPQMIQRLQGIHNHIGSSDSLNMIDIAWLTIDSLRELSVNQWGVALPPQRGLSSLLIDRYDW